ncbi:hypothetical protein CN481_20205 [Bacillus sp. AFS006103]|nr:hypothetical protein CN481_20205 [Bacillus sp. AFS006103]
MDNQIKSIIINSFIDAYKVKDRGNFVRLNTYRSSKFVYEVSKGIFSYENNNNLNLHVQSVDDDGIKSPGELLLDFMITETKDITEDKQTEEISRRGVWGGESEYKTSLKAFVEDFRKLLLINSENLIYLNGLDQKTLSGRENFIKKRLDTLSKVLTDEIVEFSKFYFAFWPSPQKQDKHKSIWDAYTIDELKVWVEVYKIEKINGEYVITKLQ